MTAPFHAITCLADICAHDCERARADGLPREPDWSLETPGQLTIDAALEEDDR